LHEPYRTLIGHLRHEFAHYYWDLLVRDTRWLQPFRELFGDERTDYPATLQRHYSEGPPADWSSRFISAYAAAHPWEDWAESFAHYLHLRATLDTAEAFNLNTTNAPVRIDPYGPEVLFAPAADPSGGVFLDWIHTWVVLTAVMNEVSRSMGQPDLYPFVLSGPVVTK